MSTDERGAFEITKDAFASIEALVKDAVGNATLTGDRKRFHIGAGYLRLAAQKSAALADLIDAVANQDRNPGRRAIKRLAQVDCDIEKHLDMVAIDNERWARESGAVRMQISNEDLEALMRGEPSAELVAKIEAAREDQESA
jgi:hypothetical protein